MLMLSNQLFLQVILFQESKLLTTKCFKEDYSHIQMHIDIDLEETILKFQSIVLTELELTMDKEMDSLPLMETGEVNSIMNLIWIKLHTTIVNMPNQNNQSAEKLVDMQILIQILSMNKLEISTEFSQSKKKMHFAQILLDQ